MKQQSATARGAAMESEHTLVAVRLQAMMSDRALKRAQQPSFQQGGHTVDMRKQILAELWCVVWREIV
jgi:hypothetical protein